MVYARLSNWKFKPGKRAEAMRILDDVVKEGRRSKGFKGIITLLSVDDPDSATFVSIWESKEALSSSQQEILLKATKATVDLLSAPPEIKNQEVHEAEMALIYA